MEAINTDKRYTYADYLTWNDGRRYELIDGVVYLMSPAPTRLHQEISGEIFLQLASFLKGKLCKVFHAPFDVRLAQKDKDDAVCQPDLVVVCDKSKLDDKGCNGAPDFIVEILSPSSGKHDTLTKFNKYLEAGVREYWIVDPERRTVSVHILDNEKYMSSAYGDTDLVAVNVLGGCVIDFNEVFPEAPEEVILKPHGV